MNLDHNTWEFINTFASWPAAIGTLLAVITSLYLARKDNKIKLTLNSSIMKIYFPQGGPGNGEEYVFITVTNIRRRPATITNIYFKVGFIRKKTYVIVPPPSPQIPAKLNDGDELIFKFPMAFFDPNFTTVAEKYFKKRGLFFKSFNIKIGGFISTGASFEVRMNKNLRKRFLLRAKELKNH